MLDPMDAYEDALDNPEPEPDMNDTELDDTVERLVNDMLRERERMHVDGRDMTDGFGQ